MDVGWVGGLPAFQRFLLGLLIRRVKQAAGCIAIFQLGGL
jgi:hypothetical protein